MVEEILNMHLRELKFVVLADAKTRKPFEIFFGFILPNMHSDIFEEAKKQYALKGKEVCIQGGGRITKKDNYIVFYGTSQKYKRYEDDVVLKLAPCHRYFKDKNYIFLSKAGEDNVYKIIETYENEKKLNLKYN
jgi:hypothetical protein